MWGIFSSLDIRTLHNGALAQLLKWYFYEVCGFKCFLHVLQVDAIHLFSEYSTLYFTL